MSDVPEGKFRLYSLFRPVWHSGDHWLWLEQSVTEAGEATPLVQTAKGQQTEFKFKVSGLRYTLPPSEVLGCYPAPGAEGCADGILPHVVLRRRTLPWENRLKSTHADPTTHPPADTPWLALLLLPAEGAKVEAGPVSKVFSAQKLQQLGMDGAQVCDQLVLSRGLLRSVMPRKADLALLTHARQVSLNDREAQDDEDGFMAVVLSNRLPEPNSTQLACLVSLEGRWDDDLWPGPAELLPVSFLAESPGGEAVSDLLATQVATPPVLSMSLDSGALVEGEAPNDAAPNAEAPKEAAAADALVSDDARALEADGAALQGDFAGDPQPGPSPEPGPHLPGMDQLIQMRLIVLHAWTFTTGAAGDFEAILKQVGSHGVERFGSSTSAQAGFVPLERLQRSGQQDQVLYRGPLVPVALARDPDLATSGDAALEQTAEGQALVSYSAAFELGRLLTLGQESALQALQGWRGGSQECGARRHLLEDTFKPLAKQVVPVLPPNAEEIFGSIWQGAPALDAGRLAAFAGDPSGIAHLMEEVPGLTWSHLSQYKPELLSVEFSSPRSIQAHQALGGVSGPVVQGQLPALDASAMPLADPGLGAAFEVGFGDLMQLALDVEEP